MIYFKFAKGGSLAALILVMAGMWGSFGVATDMNMPKSEPATKEAMAIAQLLRTQALIGAQATEETITQQMEKASLIHLATHGLIDAIFLPRTAQKRRSPSAKPC